MTQLETLASVQGRTLLRDIFRELRFERRVSALQALSTLWRICTTEQELIRLTKRDVVILHPLGVWSGTTLWMQEIVNRYFYAPINAFVYAGAAVLLVIVGLNRTGVMDQPWLIVSGVVLEAVLLLVLFIVMYFTPPEEPEAESDRQGAGAATEELLRELGEIGRDYAAMAVQLEAISGSLVELVEKQQTMAENMTESVNAAVSAVSPNPELMASMQTTTASLDRFASSVDALSQRLQAVQKQEVERLVRDELEKILSRRIMSADERPSSTSPSD